MSNRIVCESFESTRRLATRRIKSEALSGWLNPNHSYNSRYVSVFQEFVIR